MTDPDASPPGSAPLAPPPGLGELFGGMLQVALSAFGGGLSAWSQRILVERRRWLSEVQFLTGLTVARLLPGPNQINLAIYIGTGFQGLAGALAALAGMLLVPFSLLLALGVTYFTLHGLPAVDRVLAGVVAAAAGMALAMGFRVLGTYRHDPAALLLAAAVFAALTWGHLRLVPVLLVAGPVAMAWYWPRSAGRP
ncbi:MAG: chromate transporter [Synechococcaceae cyanobacterium]|nr:chromate transporter [Synechococcaceae cyanobacterium]